MKALAAAGLALAALLAAGPALAVPLAEGDDAWVGWQAAYAKGGKAAATSQHSFLASTHQFPVVVMNEAAAPLRNVTLVVEAPRQPFELSIEGPDPADAGANGTKPYAFWTALPRPGDNLTKLGCACGFVLLHSEHSDDFGGPFEWVARLFYERPDGSRAYAESLLSGTIEGGAFRFQPWQVWLVGAGVAAALGAAVWASRKR